MKRMFQPGARLVFNILICALCVGFGLSARAEITEMTFADVLQFNSSTPCERVDSEINDAFPASLKTIWRDARAICQIEALSDTNLDSLNWHNPRVATLASGSDLHVFVVSNDAPTICCSLWSESLQQVDGLALWRASFRVQDLEKAWFAFDVHNSDDEKIADTVFYGDGKFARPQIEGVIRRFTLADARNDQFRQVFVYHTPEDLPAPVRTVLLLDGESIFDFAFHIEKAISAGELSSTAVIGISSGPFAIEGNSEATSNETRSQEYRPATRDEFPLFDNHVEFVTKTVVPWAGSYLSLPSRREDMTIAGFSNGAQFSAWILKEHSDVFQSAIIMSPGESVAKMSGLLPADVIAFVSAGLYEPPFLAAARATQTRFEDAGATTTLQIVNAGHDKANWTEAMIEGLSFIEKQTSDTQDR